MVEQAHLSPVVPVISFHGINEVADCKKYVDERRALQEAIDKMQGGTGPVIPMKAVEYGAGVKSFFLRFYLQGTNGLTEIAKWLDQLEASGQFKLKRDNKGNRMIDVIGHSNGGTVARYAIKYGTTYGFVVRHVVLSGVPLGGIDGLKLLGVDSKTTPWIYRFFYVFIAKLLSVFITPLQYFYNPNYIVREDSRKKLNTGSRSFRGSGWWSSIWFASLIGFVLTPFNAFLKCFCGTPLENWWTDFNQLTLEKSIGNVLLVGFKNDQIVTPLLSALTYQRDEHGIYVSGKKNGLWKQLGFENLQKEGRKVFSYISDAPMHDDLQMDEFRDIVGHFLFKQLDVDDAEAPYSEFFGELNEEHLLV